MINSNAYCSCNFFISISMIRREKEKNDLIIFGTKKIIKRESGLRFSRFSYLFFGEIDINIVSKLLHDSSPFRNTHK